MNGLKIGQLLIKNNLISESQLNFGLDVQRLHSDKKIGEILRYYQFISDLNIAEVLSEQMGWNCFKGIYQPDQQAIDRIGVDYLRQNMVYPLKSKEEKIFIISQTDNTQVTDHIQTHFYERTKFLLGAESAIRKALNDITQTVNRSSQPRPPETHKTDIDNNAVDQWFDNLLNRAILKRATDIHIETSHLAIEIRFRVDGILIFEESIDRVFQTKLTNIIFSKSNIEISSFRKFHDARFEHEFLNKKIDIRVSHIPSIHHSVLVLRLLDKSKASVEINDLQYSSRNLELLMDAIARPDGIVLFTGPTGCGKTTALYAILNHLKSLTKKIVTVEDPVEITVPMITQVQINSKHEVTFEKVTRSFLRHDPDIILVGEIRDHETADIAVKASLTGHQVFSTLHTISPIDSLLRLKDLNVSVSLIANSLVAVVAQRLVRKLCPHCKRPVDIDPAAVPKHHQKYLERAGTNCVYIAEGCDHCIDGYKERIAVVEIFYVNDEIKSLISQDKIAEIYALISRDPDYLTLIDDAARLIKQGVTSLDEVTRVLG